ncbi:MAG: outer membrane lipoprotein-sorting protein [Pseudomonadales bacterium]|nr:outer membrane lipoprotein-sorting protein [Pseudomonadales bacterium]
MSKYVAALVVINLPGFAAVTNAQDGAGGSEPGAAITAQQRGLEIAAEADRRASGYGDSEEVFTMTLRDKRGNQRTRTLRLRSLEQTDDGDWSLTIFDEPADVKGTALLTYSHGLEPDDQWIFLPALKRVKRISSKNKSGPFMGSEFAFEDLSSFELEKYHYAYLRDEACGELQCTVSEWIPAYEHSGYSRMEVWQDQSEYRSHRIEFYDRNGNHLKTLLMDDYRLFEERFWRPMHWQMTNHKTGKVTELDYDSIEFGMGFTPRDFDQNSLKSAK